MAVTRILLAAVLTVALIELVLTGFDVFSFLNGPTGETTL